MKKYILMASCFALSACLGASDGKPLAQMTFAHIKAEPVYIASYETVALPPSKKPGLPMGFIADPSNIAYDYLNNRFAAAGTTGKLRAIIEGVSVTHEILPSTNEVGAALGIGKRDHYKITLKIKLDAIGINGFARKGVSLVAKRDVYISEHVSIVQREKEQMNALDLLIDDLDIAIQKTLRDDFNLLN